MPVVPEIKRCDISIQEKYTQGYDEAACAAGLWSIYNVIKAIARSGEEESEIRKTLHYLYCIGFFGRFEDGGTASLRVNGQERNVKAGAFFPKPRYLFALERFGFRIFDMKLEDDSKPRGKLTIKDILSFGAAFDGDEHTLLGLKLFAAACSGMVGDPFYAGDIRVMFKGASKLYAPPADEVFRTLTDGQRKVMAALHDKLEALGCQRCLEREYMMRYTHPEAKGKTFATLYTVNQPWFGAAGEATDVQIKLNLRNIGLYAHFLGQCVPSVTQAVLSAESCGGCKKACGGVVFELEGVRHVKCPWHILRFADFSEAALGDYLKLIELEDGQLRGQVRRMSGARRRVREALKH